jgi:hypothetical protein
MNDDESSLIPINSLFDTSGVAPNLETDPRQELKDAEVIFGVDVMTRDQFLLYGRPTLKRISEGGESRSVKVMRIELDQDSDDLERILALMEVVKGRHDYQ